MSRILLVDAEPDPVVALKGNLEREGYDVLSSADLEQALVVVRELKPDLVILEPMLPGLHGFEVCRALRRVSTVPIIILTARSDEIDKVVALELGADDYVTKPFGMKELIARVRTLLRRADPSREHSEDLLTGGGIIVDLRKWEATKAGVPLDLKHKELELLILLMRNGGRVMTRTQLLQKVWGYDSVGLTRTVDVHIARLRRKIEDTPKRPTVLISTRGVGYSFRP